MIIDKATAGKLGAALVVLGQHHEKPGAPPLFGGAVREYPTAAILQWLERSSEICTIN